MELFRRFSKKQNLTFRGRKKVLKSIAKIFEGFGQISSFLLLKKVPYLTQKEIALFNSKEITIFN